MVQKEITDFQTILNKTAEENNAKVHKEIKELQTTMEKIYVQRRGAEENKVGVTYVRWGRTACSAPATTVYTGDSMTFLVYVPPSIEKGKLRSKKKWSDFIDTSLLHKSEIHVQ